MKDWACHVKRLNAAYHALLLDNGLNPEYCDVYMDMLAFHAQNLEQGRKINGEIARRS